MPTEEKARQYSKWMGILYGIIVGSELAGHYEMSYAEIEQWMLAQGCTPEMLAKVYKELHRFNTVVERIEADR